MSPTRHGREETEVPQPLDQYDAVRSVVLDDNLWSAHEHHEVVTSTNDVALDRLRSGAPPGLVVTADHQTAGRGRAGRSWTDVEAAHGPGSLAVTATAAVPEAAAGLVPLAAGVAVLAAFAASGAAGALKWPNDVLLRRPEDDEPVAKAAGILVERHRVQADLDVLLIGCGLDLDWRGVERTGEVAAWTSLAECVDADVDRGRVLADLVSSLGRWLMVLPHHPGDLLHTYRVACVTLGRRVRAEQPGAAPVEGVAAELDDAGALRIETAAGSVTVTAGDVHHLRPT